MMMITDRTIATMKFFWSISANFYRRAGQRRDGSGRDRGNGIEALSAPRSAAAEATGGEPAAAQRAVACHGLRGVGRAGRLVAAGADEKISQRELIETDRAAHQPRSKPRKGGGEHAARKLAIRRARRKASGGGHGVASALSRFRASINSWRSWAKSRLRAAWRPIST